MLQKFNAISSFKPVTTSNTSSVDPDWININALRYT